MSKSVKKLWSGALKGKVFWQSFNTPNQMSGKYQYNLADLSGPACALLAKHGIEVRNKGDDQGNFVVSKSKYPIRVVNTAGDDMTDMPVGNGSEVRVAAEIIEITNNFGTFSMLQTHKVVVDELVVYDADGEGGTVNVDMDAAI